ncbi:MAG: energy transducer TonB [Gammaproteobacteria bacterium]|jgi:protein TonB
MVRYAIAFVGGLVAAVALFLFMRDLIPAPHAVVQRPAGPGVLITRTRADTPVKPRPPHEKPPQRPRHLKQPAGPTPPRVQPPEIIQPPKVSKVSLPPSLLHADQVRIDRPGYPSGDGNGSGEVMPVALVQPVYPVKAVRDGIEGRVEVEFTVGPQGNVSEVSIIKATPTGYFETAARRAVMKWKFRPRVENGRPVSRRVRQTLQFRLPGGA